VATCSSTRRRCPALPDGVEALTPGQRVEFGVAAGKRGEQALSIVVLETPPSLAAAETRRPAEELHGMVEDMIKLLESNVQRDLRRGKYPPKPAAKKIADVLHAVARELDS
jgi:cold shock protein